MTDKPLSLYLDTAQLAALGALTAQWTFFETEVEFTIRETLKNQAAGAGMG
jgi:hypothetical protein